MNQHQSFDQTDYTDLPHNLGAEQALLGAILLNNDAFGLVETFLDPEHFFEPAHQEIYQAIASRIRADKRADPVTLSPHFEGRSINDKLSFKQYLASLCGAATTIFNAKQYGEAVYDEAVRRAIIVVSEGAIESALHSKADSDPSKTIETTISRLEEVVASTGDRHRIESGWADSLADEFVSSLDDDTAPGISWGLAPLDRFAGGIQPQTLTIIAGRPSMGKSTLASSLARAMAVQGTGVLFISLEMNRTSVIARMMSDMLYNRDSPVEYQKMMRRTLNLTDRERIKATLSDFKGLPLDIVKTSGLTVDRLRSIIRQKKKLFERKGLTLDVVMIDYLGLMKASGRYAGNKVHEVGEISAGLATIANDLVPVVAMSQLSRALENRDDKRPTLSDLRNSGDIEQDADTVMFVYREHYYLERRLKGKSAPTEEETDRLDAIANTLEIIVDKQRNGPIGSIKIRVDMGSAAVREAT